MGDWHSIRGTHQIFVGAALCVALGGSAEAAPVLVCSTVTDCSFTRSVDFWYGTLTPIDVAAPPQDFFESTDHLPKTLQDVITLIGGVDPRVTAGMPPFVDLTIGAIEWVLTDPEGLPAQTNLLASYINAASALSTSFGLGTLATLPPVVHPRSMYTLGTATSVCDQPQCGGSEEQPILIEVDYIADVGFFEQNATWQPRDATPVPEPATGALIAFGLAALARMRARSRASG
jgi:hypothetical protein